MVIIDLINDEAPLFLDAARKLIDEGTLEQGEVIGVAEGTRWQNEIGDFTVTNRLIYFEHLEEQQVDLENEIQRISETYDNFNIYACDRLLIEKPRHIQEKFLVYNYLFYEQLFEQNVTHYFTTGIAYSYNYISYQICQRFGVRHISFYGTRLKNATAVSYDITNTFNEVLDCFKNYKRELVTKSMRRPIYDFVNRPEQPIYMKNAINASSIKSIFVKEFFIRFNKFYLKPRHKFDFFTRDPFTLSWLKLKKIGRARLIDALHNAIFDPVDFDEPYFIFPLHMQPEASTLVLAPYYVDQKAAIINISKLLPPSVKMYVKEHKSALGQHTLSFYRELKKHPNIKVISYRANIFDLINNSKGTINLSSTVGWESLILKVPCITMGEVFYNDTGLTLKVDSYDQLRSAIHMVLHENFHIEEYFEEYEEKLAYYIHCLNTNSYDFEFNVAKLDTKDRVLKKGNIAGMAECLARQIAKN